MVRDILLYIILIIGLNSLIHIGFYSIGANAYDVWQYYRKRTQRKAATTTKPAKKPLVSVVIPAHNESVGIKRTLDTVRASSYPNIEIIVVDDGSKDDTARVVRKYIKREPELKIGTYMARYNRSSKLQRRFISGMVNKTRIVLVSQENGGKASAVNNALNNYVRGEFVMTLDADSVLSPKAIENAVSYFSNPKVVGVAANVRVMDSRSLLGILQKFEYMVGYRSKKFYTLTNSEFIIGGVASTYRTDVLRRVGLYDTDTLTEDIGLSLKIMADGGNRTQKIVYASDVVAATEGVQSFKSLLRQRYRWKMGMLQNIFKFRTMIGSNDKKYGLFLTMYRLPMAVYSEFVLLLQPFIMAFLIYLSFYYHTFGLLGGAYITVTMYVLSVLWPDEHTSVRNKFIQSFLAPFLYFVFYVMDAVQIISAIKCVVHFKLVARGNGSVWVSPERIGDNQAQYS